MSNQYQSFLGFLQEINPVAAQNAKLMEELIYKDPSSAIVKGRLFAEALLEEVFEIEEINEPYVTKLYERISFLARKGYITKEIQKSFDTIRLAGNKAAHDGTYNYISDAFNVHEEMYKLGVWFYEVYSKGDIKLPPYEIPKQKEKENIEDIVQEQLKKILGTVDFKDFGSTPSRVNLPDDETFKKEANIDNAGLIFKKEIEPDQSYLIRELTRLKDSAQEAVENANQFSAFKKYLHVDRKIQLDLERILEQNNNEKSNNLILLCGSVGDGKSHLLAYIKEQKPELIKDYTIFNDATESFSPNMNALETLEEILQDFSDQKINLSNNKVILAINMGVLHNFINHKHENFTYKQLKEFIVQSGLFTEKVTTSYSNTYFDLLSFGDYHSFELTREGAESTFYSSLLNKIVNESNDNPFYLAYKEDEEMNKHLTVVHQNYRFLQNEFVRKQIVQLVIQTIVTNKLVISARAFLNFIADILIPGNIKNIELSNEFEVLETSLPNLIFNRSDRSDILKYMSEKDPIHIRSEHIDKIIVELNTLNDLSQVVDTYNLPAIAKKWLNPFLTKDEIAGHTLNSFIESFIRILYLSNEKFAKSLADKSLRSFLEYLYYFNVNDKRKVKEFYEEVKKSVYLWQGTIRKDYVYMNKTKNDYRIAQKLNMKPTIKHLATFEEDSLDTFRSTIPLVYIDEINNKDIFLDIDFPLYKLLSKIQEGYRPNKSDEEDAIKFVEFIDKLMSIGEKKNEILIFFPKDNRDYLLKRDDFGAYVFERKS